MQHNFDFYFNNLSNLYINVYINGKTEAGDTHSVRTPGLRDMS